MVNEKGDVKGYLRVAVQAVLGGEEEHAILFYTICRLVLLSKDNEQRTPLSMILNWLNFFLSFYVLVYGFN